MSANLQSTSVENVPQQYRTLLEIADAIAAHQDVTSLLKDLAARLQHVVEADGMNILLYDEERQVMRLHSLVSAVLPQAEVIPELPIEEAPAGWVWQNQQPLLMNDLAAIEARYPRIIAELRTYGIQSGYALPLTSAGRRLGVLGFGSRNANAYNEEQQAFLQQVAKLVAVALDNTLNFEHARQAEAEAKRRSEELQLLLDINNAVVSQLDLHALARVTATRLREVLGHDVTGMSLYDEATNQFRAYMFDLPTNLPLIPEGTLMPLEGTVGGLAFFSGQPVFLPRYEAEFLTSEFDRRLMEAGIRSGGVVPLIAHDRKLGFLGVGSLREDAFSEADQELLCHIANQIAIAVENALNFEHARATEQQAQSHSDRVQLLLEVNNAIASALDLPSLFRAVSACLRQVFRHDYAVMGLYNEQEDILRVHLLDKGDDIDILREGQIATLVDTPVGLAIRTKQVVVTGPDYLSEFPAEVVQRAVSQGIRANCSAPLLRNNRVIGAMSIASKTECAFTQEDGELFMQIAGQVAIAVENALNFTRAQTAEEEAKRQSQRRQLLLEINNAMVAQLDLRSLIQVISASLRRISRHDVVGLALYDPATNELRAYAYDSLDKQFVIEEGTLIPLESSLSGTAFTLGQPFFHDRIDEGRFQSDFSQRFRAAGLKSGGVVPLIAHGRKLGTLAVASYPEAHLNEDEKELLCQVANQVALAVENALAFREIEALKNKLTSEKLYLEDEIRTQNNFEELIGESQTFRRILKQVETVAPTDSTVLIRGETGTGKELIARAIHHLSTRRERTLVKINCAAIPTGLLESELFGHEKGAFTGAIAQRIGRFELAHHGTLLLDEVGDIPLELQSKLLRVLQEQEFERLGSTRTQRVDVRLIAATNCDLEQMVADRKYRSDLYYRLNVFPITIPPLRQRREDIPALTRFFTQKYARRLKKPITAIPAEAMAALTAYHWPGNVRELEHFIERAVILTHGAELEVSLAELKSAEPVSTAALPTLETAEREHILRALNETNWVIGGPQGAAAKLGMKRTTLQSRIQKLGISR